MSRIYQKLLLACIGMVFLHALSAHPSARAGLPSAQISQPAIDAYVEAQMQEYRIPGIAVAVVRGDEIVHARGYGVAGDSGRPMTPQTPFLIASLSKSFTAMGIMQLVEEGKIDLDAPVQTYLPWFQVAEEDNSAKITIRHLLNQTSGFSEREGYKRNLDTNPAGDALEASVRALSKQSLNSPPGASFEYSNTNYDVLGLVIQAVSGQPYGAYVQEKIFTPLGMNHSYTSLAEARRAQLTSGYYPFFGFPLAIDRFLPYSQVTVPSAGLFSSAEDMARYLITHLNQGRYLDGSILSPDGIAELHAPAAKIGGEVSYAMGWVTFPFSDAVIETGDPVPTAISHGGDWVGYQANMVMVPEHALGVVVLVNKSDSSSGSAYANLGWNLSLLALGLEPVDYPTADFLTRNGRLLLAGVILLLGISLVWSVRKIRLLSLQPAVVGRQRRKLIAQVILLALVDLVLAGWLLFVKLPEDNNTLTLALRFSPDIGLMYLLLLVITLGWGLVRTVLFAVQLRETPAPAMV